MASINKVILLGNLTADPSLRNLPSGQNVCEMRMAINRRISGTNGQENTETCFVDVVVWGKQAENCSRYLAKGSSVLVEGRLQFDQWEDRNGGGKRSKLRVVAEQVQFMSRRDDRENGGADGNVGGGYNNNGGYNGNGGYSGPQNNGGRRFEGGSQHGGMPEMPSMGNGDDAGVDDIPF